MTTTSDHRPVEIVPGKVYAITAPIPLDGTASWAPVLPGRAQSINIYLLKEGDQSLLVDTGVQALWPSFSDQLARLVEPATSLKVFITRPEPDCSGNLSLIRDRYEMEDTDVLAGGSDNPFDFFDTAATRRSQEKGQRQYTPGVLRTNGFDLSPSRAVRVIVPKLRFLPSYWPFDVATRTLFTSDIFTHIDQLEGEGLPVSDGLGDVTPAENVANHLFSKFWWLPGATTEEFVEDLESIFDRLQPEIIAPGYGGIIRGREAVSAHLERVTGVLRDSQLGRYGQPRV